MDISLTVRVCRRDDWEKTSGLVQPQPVTVPVSSASGSDQGRQTGASQEWAEKSIGLSSQRIAKSKSNSALSLY